MSYLPRADVGTGALAAALIGLLMAGLNGATDANVYAPLAVVVITFIIEYAVPTHKELAGTIAGAVVVVGVAIYFASVGLGYDEVALNLALVYLTGLVLTWALPRSQP